ncbi:GspH/FimT family pseudopilin [Macromonas nakdongensis]|uniref:GspH/FimT family pseudopilin n=1 Tax=Macromonas nakdongensis TaxID=1843082 RepID=UPI000C32BFA0|nr:GspH/FimT family pseudopilin [Macromonas nakdongensis]
MKHAFGARSRGLTLLEALMSLSILAILTSIGIPIAKHLQQNMQLKGAAEALTSELRHAQSESVKRQAGFSVNFRTNGDTWCYGYSIDISCDCTVPTSCSIDNLEQVRRHHQYPGVRILPSVSGNRFSFQPRRGTVTAGSVTLTASNGKQLRVVVSGLGRIRTCTPTGEARFTGYPLC